MTRLPSLLVLSTAASLAGCATTGISDRDQMQVSLRYSNAHLELAQSMWVGPFWRDDSRRLLSVVRPGEDVMLVTPQGAPMSPGEPTGILPAGTKVTVLKVTFATGWEMTTRPLLTPRDRPWIALAVSGQPSPEYMLVLPPDPKNEDDVFAVVGKLLTDQPVDEEVAKLSPADQKAVTAKELVAGLSMRALELAFGPPLLRRIYGEKDGPAEEWTWQSDTTRQIAHLKNGVVASVENLNRTATGVTPAGP